MNGYLDSVGMDELKDWNQAKLLVPAHFIMGVFIILLPAFALDGNPFWWVAVVIGGVVAGVLWFFAILFYVISTPITIHKVNGHWEMKR